MSQSLSTPESRTQIWVLLVDDDPDFAETAANLLEREHEAFDVRPVTDPVEAMTVFDREPIDAVVSDYRMPEWTGLDLLAELRTRDPTLPFFLCTGRGSEDIASKAISAGVTDYLTKEPGSDQYAVLANRIRNAVSGRQSERTLRENESFLQDVFDGIRNGLAVVDEELELLRVNEWLESRAAEPLTGRHCHAVFQERETPCVDCPVQKTITSGTRQRIETKLSTLGDPFWAEVSTHPLTTSPDSPRRVLLQIMDISERKRREQKLEKRERLFRELQEHTTACLGTDSRAGLMAQLTDSMDSSLAHSEIAVLGYDPDSGGLRVEGHTEAFEAGLGRMEPVRPGEGPLWQTFQDGQTRVIASKAINSIFEAGPELGTDFVAVPVTDYGVVLVHRTEPVDFPEIDIELLNLCSANAAAILARIEKEGKLGSVTDRVSVQADRIDSLRGFLRSIERIHQRLAGSETRSGMEQTLVRELVDAEGIDFAWIGHPRTDQTDLVPTAWAGRESGYLDRLDLTSESDPVPAQEATATRSSVSIQNISEHLQTTGWATEALSLEFSAVLAAPIEYDGVLYGVLSVYSKRAGYFNRTTESLLSEVTALLASYIGVQNRRIGEGNTAAVELEFSLTDQNQPLFSLSAATGYTVRFETLLETHEESVRIIVTVPEAADDAFLEDAMALTKIRDAAWFGDPGERTVVLELDRPFLGTGVGKHGGTLKQLTADGTEARLTIDVPATNQTRPLVQWLQQTYRDIDLVAKRAPETVPSADRSVLEESLTDRQLEILQAAVVGGYFETPRKVTGEDLAASFDISDSAVYQHLRAAQGRLFDQLFDISAENEGLDS